jgi:hypothetical protein
VQCLQVCLILRSARGALVRAQILQTDDWHIQILDRADFSSSVTIAEIHTRNSAMDLDAHGLLADADEFFRFQEWPMGNRIIGKAELPESGRQTILIFRRDCHPDIEVSGRAVIAVIVHGHPADHKILNPLPVQESQEIEEVGQ